jgi:PhnB protein
MQKMYPYLLYEDMAGTPEFLKKAFGFRRVEVRAVPDGHHRHTHVEMELDDGSRVRMTQKGDGYRSPRTTGHASVMIQINVDDIDAHFGRAQAAGATIVRPLQERRYGDRGYIADDLEGQRWYFIESVSDDTDG